MTIKPDYTISASNPEASITMTPEGEITGEATTRIALRAPQVDIATNSFNMTNMDGGKVTAKIVGDIDQDGTHTTTGDQVAGTISQLEHVHKDVQPGTGNSGEPV